MQNIPHSHIHNQLVQGCVSPMHQCTLDPIVNSPAVFTTHSIALEWRCGIGCVFLSFDGSQQQHDSTRRGSLTNSGSGLPGAVHIGHINVFRVLPGTLNDTLSVCK